MSVRPKTKQFDLVFGDVVETRDQSGRGFEKGSLYIHTEFWLDEDGETLLFRSLSGLVGDESSRRWLSRVYQASELKGRAASTRDDGGRGRGWDAPKLTLAEAVRASVVIHDEFTAAAMKEFERKKDAP